MSPQLLTPPAAEPLTADEAATMARLDGGPHWVPILELAIKAARAVAEHETGRRLMQQTWRHTLPAFPVAADRVPELLPTAVAVAYRTQAGAWVTLDPQAYAWAVDAEGLVLVPAAGTSWPAAVPDVTGAAVRVDVTSGAATAAAVPAEARQFVAAMTTVMAHDPSLTTAQVLGGNAYLLRILDPLRLYA